MPPRSLTVFYALSSALVVEDLCFPQVIQSSQAHKAPEAKFQLSHVQKAQFTESLYSSLLPLPDTLPPFYPEHIETSVMVFCSCVWTALEASRFPNLSATR